MKRIVFLLSLLAGLSVPAARAESPRRLNNEGVAAYRGKKFDQAVRAFEKAREQAPENLLLRYNLGAAHSAAKQPDEAMGDFGTVSAARDEALADRARFAQGVLQYQKAEKQIEQKDLQGALTSVKEAVAANQAVLLSDPGEADARVNFELASLLQKKIEQQLQQQQQKQDQKNQNDKQQQNQKPEDKQKQQEQQGQKDQEKRQDQQQQAQAGATPTPTPSAGQKPQQPRPGEQKKEPAKEQPAQLQQAKAGQNPKDQETLSGLLNAVQDNDPEILKKMLKKRFGNMVGPSKDW